MQAAPGTSARAARSPAQHDTRCACRPAERRGQPGKSGADLLRASTALEPSCGFSALACALRPPGCLHATRMLARARAVCSSSMQLVLDTRGDLHLLLFHWRPVGAEFRTQTRQQIRLDARLGQAVLLTELPELRHGETAELGRRRPLHKTNDAPARASDALGCNARASACSVADAHGSESASTNAPVLVRVP